MGGSATVALYPSNGCQICQNGIRGIVTLCELLGLRIRDAHQHPAMPLAEILVQPNGHQLFVRMLIAVVRRTARGFNVGAIKIAGFNDFQDQHLSVLIQKANLLALRKAQPIEQPPD